MNYNPKIHKSKLEVTPWTLDKSSNVVTFTLNNKYGDFDVKVDKEDWDRIVENNSVPQVFARYRKGKVTAYFRVRIRDKNKRIKRPKESGHTYKQSLLHRWILGEENIPEGMQIDHINGNPLDNRKENLRICNHLENSMNRTNKFNPYSKYMGVSYNRGKKRKVSTGSYRCISRPWRSTITLPEGKKISLGTFKTEIEAAIAWDKAALKYFPKFARLNFPEKNKAT